MWNIFMYNIWQINKEAQTESVADSLSQDDKEVAYNRYCSLHVL